MKNYKETELQELLAAVENDIVSLVKGEQEKLSKAHPGEETSSEVPADESATAPADAESAPAEGSAPPAPPADSAPADASAPAPAGDEGAPPADASPPAAGGDPAADQGADPAALEAEYSKLPPEDLKAHYMACKSALFALMGGAGPDAGAAPGPEAPPAAPPAPPATPDQDPSAPPALKAELKSDVKANGENPLHKSQKDAKIESLEAELVKSNQGMEALAQIVKGFMKPVRKAVTSVAHLAKTAEETVTEGVSSLSREDVKAKLRRAVENPKLSKSDRDLVYGFDVGQVKVEQIAHLLK